MGRSYFHSTHFDGLVKSKTPDSKGFHSSMDELRVESIKKSAGRTKIIMEHIRAALAGWVTLSGL